MAIIWEKILLHAWWGSYSIYQQGLTVKGIKYILQLFLFSLLWWVLEWDGFLNERKKRKAVTWLFIVSIGLVDQCCFLSHLSGSLVERKNYCQCTRHERRAVVVRTMGTSFLWLKIMRAHEKSFITNTTMFHKNKNCQFWLNGGFKANQPTLDPLIQGQEWAGPGFILTPLRIFSRSLTLVGWMISRIKFRQH